MPVKTNRRVDRAPRHLTQRGSMMIEVLVSVVLLSISVLGLVRILGQSVKDSGELGYRSVASTMADETIGRMWVMDPADLDDYATAVSGGLSQLPGGARAVAVNGDIVTITITWQAPGAASASQYNISATLARNPT
jgi:type IV pilus assembly protein PilV